MMPKDFLPALDKLHGDSRIHRFADNIVYLTSDPDLKRLDTDTFFSIFADHPKRARAWWAVAVETTDEPFTREYSVESFGTDYLFRVRIRLGFKVSQSIPAYRGCGCFFGRSGGQSKTSAVLHGAHPVQ